MRYISVEEAIALLIHHTPPLQETEWVPLTQSSGRTLAMTITAQSAAPPFARSAMDGYALKALDTPGTFRIAGYVSAGEVLRKPLQAGDAVRIMTGAPLPEGLDAVIEQEAVELQAGVVHVAQRVQPGRNVTLQGSEFPQGTVLMRPGQRLGSLQIGVLALGGYAHIAVYRRLRVLLVTSGDELIDPGNALGPGQIYNVNASLFYSLLHELGADVTVQHLPDTLDAVHEFFNRPDLAAYDLVLTTGGVSVGDKDHIIHFLQQRAQLLFWRTDMHPGKSIAAARYQGTTILALSGNPGAALMSWYNIALPFLVALLHAQLPIERMSGRLLQDFPKKTRETRFLRARLIRQPDGWYFDTNLPQQSDRITTYEAADVLVVIPHGSPPVPAGTVLEGKKIPGLGSLHLTWIARENVASDPNS
ncbi:molybdopterin molybdotransferase MoeA [Sulfobacillus sp. hq2]|uniref:molybdopterin molybdotransferase MoeA n=1 Tax=Sulfobacillus TaxID=28033 RepID=UPI000CD1E6A9|nr:molybdopterin molybdotransferase MoeA [Sulfobacillus sp. hq2]POB11138.1 molybdenum cofactor synthesis protein [Sulfobacillus sp. hq2]